ncbi:MAG: UDP-glucose--hexose-1-phosphate uridylyltransferase [Clostridiales Family XIII bacterium]|jgi:UDPglucose--hexose-1-phosphate uridylyltransferase|nr:UDP-glucose--hexose-1-phosphate uridylyltransferase [Clostridiales Family XIII bacterium]
MSTATDQNQVATVQVAIEQFLNYALDRAIIVARDVQYYRNILLHRLGLHAPCIGWVPEDVKLIPENAEAAVAPLLDYLLGVDSTITQRDLLDAELFGLLMNSPSVIEQKFWVDYRTSQTFATDNFYKLMQDVDYIRSARIAKNVAWKTASDYGDLDITINLSKPEKDPRDIAAALENQDDTAYPACLLCTDNEGYAGNLNHPARENIRLIEMGGWFFQYSPYSYYNEHCIVLSPEHEPMVITEKSFERLIHLTDILPEYFFGSNTDIPIVGGSILTHDHYQGGKYTFALMKSDVRARYTHRDYTHVEIDILHWPMSTIRLRGFDKEEIIALSMRILKTWYAYSDEEAEILANAADGTRHQAITPIARRVGNDNEQYELNLVLRNNRTSEAHPMGIFHPHKEWHHIKKENIGLIEVMGLAILPPRLLPLIADGTYTEDYIGEVFAHILEDAGVFKQTEVGLRQFEKFMFAVGCDVR